MIHRGIEYTIRKSLGRDEWILTYSPMVGRVINRNYTGTKDEALKAAQRAIDRWLENHAHETREPSEPSN
jgi:3-oxoacyl-[acyl-carrier-protein] synthase III